MKKKYNLAVNILKSNFSRLSFPYKITFAVTYMCNYRCRTCLIWKRKPKDELTLEEIISFFKKSNRFNWIDFTGGEVWLRKDFVDIVGTAIRECKYLALLHFPTNGFQTDVIVRGVKDIIKMNPPKFIITVSMDGDEHLNDEIRGKKGGWIRQLETYKMLHEIPEVDVVLGMTLSSFNLGAYDSAFQAVKKECPWLTQKDFHMNIIHKSAHYYGNMDSFDDSMERDNMINELETYRKLRGIPLTPVGLLEWSYLKHTRKYLNTNKTPLKCHALHSSCFVDPVGYVYPCGMYSKTIANLRDYNYDLKAIWDLSKTIELQKNIENKQCPHCWTPCEAYPSILGNLF